MARYIEGKSRERFKIANQSIETCAELLSRTDVQAATKGLAEQAFKLLDLLYVPNEHDGAFDLTRVTGDPEKVPYIPVFTNEEPRIQLQLDQIIHPRQRDAIRNKVNEIEQKDLADSDAEFHQIVTWIAESVYEKRQKPFSVLKYVNKNDANVLRFKGAIGLEDALLSGEVKQYVVETSPIVFAKVKSLKTDEGALLFHEMVHVAQALQGTIFMPGKANRVRLKRDELEAYFAGATAEELYHGVTAEENPNKWNTLGIEAIRRRINADKDDPFHVSKKLINEIKAAGLSLR